MKKLLSTIIIVLLLIALSACGESQSAENSGALQSTDADLGYHFEEGILTVNKIYYTVLDVAGNPMCVYQEPWVSYKNRDEIRDIIIDADMVYKEDMDMLDEIISIVSELKE